jgi:hypothetical protein
MPHHRWELNGFEAAPGVRKFRHAGEGNECGGFSLPQIEHRLCGHRGWLARGTLRGTLPVWAWGWALNGDAGGKGRVCVCHVRRVVRRGVAFVLEVSRRRIVGTKKGRCQCYRRRRVTATTLTATNQSVAGSGTGRAAGATA